MTFEESLQQMKERDTQDIKNELTRLDEIHSNLPWLIERTSNLTGIDQEQLVHIAAQTVFNHSNLKWYEVISVLNTIYTTKKRLDEKGK